MVVAAWGLDISIRRINTPQSKYSLETVWRQNMIAISDLSGMGNCASTSAFEPLGGYLRNPMQIWRQNLIPSSGLTV